MSAPLPPDHAPAEAVRHAWEEPVAGEDGASAESTAAERPEGTTAERPEGTAAERPGSTAAERPAAGRADLLGLDAPALEALLGTLGERPFRARQLFAWLHGRLATSFDEMTDLSRALRARLAEAAELRAPVVDDVRQAGDGTRKYRLRTHDGHFIEAVYIPHASGPGKNALCISSQVGCAMGCTFCATAALKLTRHLTAGEIVGQLYAVLRDLQAVAATSPVPSSFDDDLQEGDVAGEPPEAPGKAPRLVQNIVFMGMGEPLHNIEGVLQAIRLFTDPRGQAMSPRRLTVSTSGLVPAIARLGAETDVHLAVSLNATTDEVRGAIMPVDKRWDIAALLEATRAFPLKPRRRITFEYVLLKGVNDSDDDARRLVALMRDQRGKVNLIPFNPHPLSPFERPDAERVEKFRSILDRGQVSCFVRTTRGLDIDAACGMLGAQKLEDARRGSLPVLA
jgi:23S rRNA (adenine2503-C2)-methyltransferase